VSHTGQISGAEMVLLDVVQLWPTASAFLFEDGPLKQALESRQLRVTVSRWGGGLAKVRRNSSVFRIASVVGRLVAVALDLGRAARQHDVLYANSQKAFVLSAIVTTFVRRPLVWHLHDIISPAHFGAVQRRVQIALANRRAAKVIVPSQAAADAFIAEGGRADLVEVVANGLDLPVDATPRVELRRHLGLPDGPLVGVFSRLAPWKGARPASIASSPATHCSARGPMRRSLTRWSTSSALRTACIFSASAMTSRG
jgi:glycosyltransferase involved in cell wall biosynthesis